MAIYHLSVKTISRSAGRSATAAAAYRAGVEITDERTGEIHDYTRKGGVESAAIILPDDAPEWARDRAQLWNAAEQAEKRKNSTVAREFEIALPAELAAAERQALAHDFASALVKRHGCAADVAIHAPGKEGDNRNHHVHILLTTRRLGPDGFGEKTRELDDKKEGKALVTEWRERWAGMANASLERHGYAERIDHRSHVARGIEDAPSRHLGPAATGYERRTGQPSEARQRIEEATERIQAARELGELERQGKEAERSIIDLSGDLEAAKRERAAQQEHRKSEQEPPKPKSVDMRAALLHLVGGQSSRGLQQQEQPPPQHEREARERQRIEGMTSAELATEIRRIRPSPVASLVERDQAVIAARDLVEQLSAQQERGQQQEARAKEQAEKWREQHQVQAWFHDKGIGHAQELRELEEQREAGRTQWLAAVPHLQDAILSKRNVEQDARERIRFEQAPALLKVDELEVLRQEKVRQEFEQQTRQDENEKKAEPRHDRGMEL